MVDRWTGGRDVLDARDVVDGFAVAGEEEAHCVQGKGPQDICVPWLGIWHGWMGGLKHATQEAWCSSSFFLASEAWLREEIEEGLGSGENFDL